MIVVCPTCSARFQYGDARFQGASAKRFKCPKCDMIFEVMNPALTVPQPLEVLLPPAPPAPQAPTETTSSDRDEMFAMAGLKGAQLPKDMRFSLAFLTGPHASTVRPLNQLVTILGREEGDVIINDPEISRRHARLEIHPDGTVWLSDLTSTNGTFLADKPILAPTQLFDRQEFSCGRSSLMLMIRTVDSMAPD